MKVPATRGGFLMAAMLSLFSATTTNSLANSSSKQQCSSSSSRLFYLSPNSDSSNTNEQLPSITTTTSSSMMKPSLSSVSLPSTTSSSSSSSSLEYVGGRISADDIVPTCVFHEPPPFPASDRSPFSLTQSSLSSSSPSSSLPSSSSYRYEENDTVFGKILRGEAPARVLAETETILSFLDHRPKAQFHGLVIPKRLVGSVFDLRPVGDENSDDLAMLLEMKQVAESIIKEYNLLSDGVSDTDYRLCFHIPPFNSVDHLHLHILAPLSKMDWFSKYVLYNTQSRRSVDLDTVIQRLQTGQPAVPYPRPPQKVSPSKPPASTEVLPSPRQQQQHKPRRLREILAFGITLG